LVAGAKVNQIQQNTLLLLYLYGFETKNQALMVYKIPATTETEEKIKGGTGIKV
jgi:hypothetical protein